MATKKRNRRGSVKRSAWLRNAAAIRRKRSDYQKRRDRLQKLGFDSYAQYLRSELWDAAKFRYQCSGRKQNCFLCNSTNTELHHRNYSLLGGEPPRHLIPLCRGCHEDTHYLMKHGGQSLWRAAHSLYRTRYNKTMWQAEDALLTMK